MTEKDFEKEYGKLIHSITDKLVVKGKEYRRDADVFHNFNKGSKVTGQSKHRVLDGFLLKHYISYQDMLNDIDQNVFPSKEVIDEKLGDIIIYFILQKLMLENNEKNYKQKTKRNKNS